MSIAGIIPARYASSRFPGKPLELLAGKPMIEHGVENGTWVYLEVRVRHCEGTLE